MVGEKAVVLEALRRHEAGDLAGVEELCHHDILVTAIEEWPESGPFEGRQAALGQFARLAADVREQRFDDLVTVADAGEWVVVRYTWRTTGRHSGIEGSFDMAAACRVTGGRIAEAHFRWTEQEALEAAGLPRGASSPPRAR